MQALLLPAYAHDTRGPDREAFEVSVILRPRCLQTGADYVGKDIIRRNEIGCARSWLSKWRLRVSNNTVHASRVRRQHAWWAFSSRRQDGAGAAMNNHLAPEAF